MLATLLPSLLLTTLSPCFKSPECWKATDPKHCLVAFIAPIEKGFAPSINLAIETIDIAPERYIDAVERLISKNRTYRRLGMLETKAGPAFLSQIENPKNGTISLQSICIRDGTAYILTGIAKKKDFSKCHRTFIRAFTSFSLLEDLMDFISDNDRKEALKLHTGELKSYLECNHQEEGTFWQLLMLDNNSREREK